MSAAKAADAITVAIKKNGNGRILCIPLPYRLSDESAYWVIPLP
jgi:hypothetical protein